MWYLVYLIWICRLDKVFWELVYCCLSLCRVFISVVFFILYFWFVILSVFCVWISFRFWIFVWCRFILVWVKLFCIVSNFVLYLESWIWVKIFLLVSSILVFLVFSDFCGNMCVLFGVNKFNLVMYWFVWVELINFFEVIFKFFCRDINLVFFFVIIVLYFLLNRMFLFCILFIILSVFVSFFLRIFRCFCVVVFFCNVLINLFFIDMSLLCIVEIVRVVFVFVLDFE